MNSTISHPGPAGIRCALTVPHQVAAVIVTLLEALLYRVPTETGKPEKCHGKVMEHEITASG